MNGAAQNLSDPSQWIESVPEALQPVNQMAIGIASIAHVIADAEAHELEIDVVGLAWAIDACANQIDRAVWPLLDDSEKKSATLSKVMQAFAKAQGLVVDEAIPA